MPFKDKKKAREYWRRYRKTNYRRYRANGNCIDCGIPCKPYWRCLEHRLKASKYNKKQYEKKRLRTLSKSA